MKISPTEFADALGNVSFPLAVAVSGGADSLALLLLAHQFAKGRVIAITVDHGLRPDSAKEALQVQAWAKERGIEHVILEWQGEKPQSRLQEKAREVRYNLLTTWCKANGVHHLLLGHHGQDQEETFWMRLAAGSGLDGLSGIKSKVIREGIILHRPLLSFSKEQLKETLSAENQDWVEDPSNQNQRFLRGRLRQSLETEGLSSTRLLNVMNKLREDSDFIQQNVDAFLKMHAQLQKEGYLTVNKEAFLNLHPAIAKRVISFLMGWFQGASYPPRSKQLETILEKIKEEQAFTAGGIYWVMKKTNITLFREVSAIQDALPLNEINSLILWDNRFWIDPAIRENVSRETFLAPVGNAEGKTVNAIPHHALISLPALWEKGKVVAILPLCYSNLSREKELQKLILLKPLFHESLMITM